MSTGPGPVPGAGFFLLRRRERRRPSHRPHSTKETSMSTPSKRPAARAKPQARRGFLNWSRSLIRTAHATLARLGTRASGALRAARDRVRRDPVPIEVLVVDPARRRTLRREIRGVVG